MLWLFTGLWSHPHVLNGNGSFYRALWECISPTHFIAFQHLLWGLFSNCSALDVMADRRSKWNKHESVNQWFRHWFSGWFKWSVVYLLFFLVLQLSMFRLCRCLFDWLQKCLIDNNGRMTQNWQKYHGKQWILKCIPAVVHYQEIIADIGDLQFRLRTLCSRVEIEDVLYILQAVLFVPYTWANNISLVSFYYHLLLGFSIG